MKYVSEYQQRAMRYQKDIIVAMREAISQCTTRLQITEPLPVLLIFQAPPPPSGPQVEDEHHVEKGNDEEDQGEESQEKKDQGDEKVEQDEDMDEGDKQLANPGKFPNPLC